MIKKIAFSFLLILYYISSFGQTDRLNKIIPPSPQLSQYAKYGDYPINHSTGVPEISIPIYEINTSKLKLPIGISYHASGFKVDDQNGILGLGWSLQAGGRISRTVQGSPDEIVPYPSIFKSENEINPGNYDDFLYLRHASSNERKEGTIDTEYDIFNFSMNNDGGKFVLARGINGNRISTPFPFRPIKIQSNSSGFNSELTFFEITDENGNTYRFGKSRYNADTNLERASIASSNRQYTSGWFLTEVISYDKTEIIKLFYTDLTQIRTHRTDMVVVEDNYEGDACSVGDCRYPTSITPEGFSTQDESTPNTSTVYTTKVLSEIQFANGKIAFNYSTGNAKELISINVLDLNNEIIKKVLFTQMPYSNHMFYKKLANLVMQDKSGNQSMKYGFEYDESIRFDGNGNQGDLTHTSAVDYWGFYNGKSSTGSIVPRFDLSVTRRQNGFSTVTRNETVSFGDRSSDENAMKVFILKKISYPTGGYTEFDFEANRSLYDIVGGLRIKKIKSNASQDNLIVKHYIYGLNENNQGELLLNPYSVNAFLQTYTGFYFPPSNNGFCTTPPAGSPCYSNRVRTISSDMIDGSSLFESNPVFYTDVAEYQESINGVLGKTAYKYDLPIIGYGSNGYSQFIRAYSDWQSRHLTRKSIFKNVGSGIDVTFALVNKEDYTYTIELGNHLTGLRSVCRYYGMANQGIQTLYKLNNFYNNAYEFFDYRIENGNKHLAKRVETSYTDNGNIVNEQVYTYNNLHNNPIQTISSGSANVTIEETFKYPTDVIYVTNSTEEDGRQKLVLANNIIEVLEKTTTKNQQQQKVKTFYKDFLSSGTPFPEKIEVSNNSVMEKRVDFDQYVSGKLVQQSVAGGIKESYIWGYNNQFPVAKISNGDYRTAINYINQSIIDNPVSDDQLRTEINKIRVNLPDAQITTFTYKPLVGMTSSTDAKGMITYYEYDEFQRLKNVKDQNGNIIKSNAYHYKN
nr:hypothetical protein [Pedobacter sp. ASV2]